MLVKRQEFADRLHRDFRRRWVIVVWHLTVRMHPFRQVMALNSRFFGAILDT